MTAKILVKLCSVLATCVYFPSLVMLPQTCIIGSGKTFEGLGTSAKRFSLTAAESSGSWLQDKLP